MPMIVSHEIIYWSIILISIFQMSSVLGQTSVVPHFPHFQMNRYDNLYQAPQPTIPNSPSSFQNIFIQKQNELFVREVEENERKRAVANRQHIVREYLKSDSIPLPDFSATSGTECFHSARKEILGMLEGKNAMSLKRAVFVTEKRRFLERVA